MQNTTKRREDVGPWRLWERHGGWLLGLVAAGIALRLFFIFHYPLITPDGYGYGDIAKNWLQTHMYAISGPNGPRATDIRMPGYPAFLAVLFALFGIDHYNAVRFLQLAVDMASCFVIADLARRVAGDRAARWAFGLAALCPFFANYTAVPLTETWSIFLAALALDMAVAALAAEERQGRALRWWAASGLAIAGSILIRPDGGILLIAIGGLVLLRFLRGPRRQRAFWAGVVLGACSLGPLLPWTLRNWRTLHEFQPLVPTSASAPGEAMPGGFNDWMRTWLADYASLEDIGFRVEGEAIQASDLPRRAFDTPDQQRRTEAAIEAYNEELYVTPEVNQEFEQLARERIRRAPLRYYAWLPLLRSASLWLRPRTEMLPVDSHWWRYEDDPRDFAVSVFFIALNLALLGMAAVGLRRRPRYAALLLAFVVIRTVLIEVLTFPEPRYVLECYPVVIVWAAALARPNLRLHAASREGAEVAAAR